MTADHLAALVALRDAVKAGDDAAFRCANRAVHTTPAQDVALQMREENCRHAYKGSTDAALAWLAAVLPGWRWTLCDDSAAIIAPEHYGDPFVQPHQLKAPTPARALLLAGLSALIHRERDAPW